ARRATAVPRRDGPARRRPRGDPPRSGAGALTPAVPDDPELGIITRQEGSLARKKTPRGLIGPGAVASARRRPSWTAGPCETNPPGGRLRHTGRSLTPAHLRLSRHS